MGLDYWTHLRMVGWYHDLVYLNYAHYSMTPGDYASTTHPTSHSPNSVATKAESPEIVTESCICSRCIAGARACPSEDCGGVPGYYRVLEVLADPHDEEHGSMLEWLLSTALCLPPSGTTTTTTHFNETLVPHESQHVTDGLLADTRAYSFQF